MSYVSTIPQFRDITDNSVVIFWDFPINSPNDILGYRLTVRNEDTGEKITQATINATSQFVGNLKPSRNYRVSLIVINSLYGTALGNSPETFNDFTTLGIPVVGATVPNSATIGFTGVTENSFLVFWDPNGDGGSAITGYHLVIKNQDTGQTVTELNTSYNTTNTLIQNLDSGTNYKAYVIVINAIGNSFEQSYGVKTLGATPTTPVVIPDGFHQMPDGSIMADSDMYNFIIEPDGKVRMIRLTGIPSTEYEIKVLPDSVESFIDRGVARLLTAAERDLPPLEPEPTPTPTPEPTFCVNVYSIRDSGSVYSTSYPEITAAKVAELEQTQFVLSCSATTVPTEKQVQDFYGFTPVPPQVDTTINSTMISQSVGAFILKDGRITGQVLYIANQSFNPFYYNKQITSLIQIKSKSGVVIAIKSNNLNFTETERDETITIDESAGNFKELLIDFFVWDSPLSQIIFSETKQIQIVDETDVDPVDPFDPQPPVTTCPAGYHKDFSGKCVADDPVGEIPKDRLIETLKGFLFGTVALSLLARKY